MIDNILIHGDYLYSLAFVTSAIPDSSALLVNNLPNYSISIDGSCWAIAYENPHQGRIHATTNCFEFCLETLDFALISSFSNTTVAILIVDGLMMALLFSANKYFLFDSHARTVNGMPDLVGGTAVLLEFLDLTELRHHISMLAAQLHVTQFEIVPVSLQNVSQNNVAGQTASVNSSAAPRVSATSSDSFTESKTKTICNNNQFQNTSMSKRKIHETDQERAKRLKKNREAKLCRKKTADNIKIQMTHPTSDATYSSRLPGATMTGGQKVNQLYMSSNENFNSYTYAVVLHPVTTSTRIRTQKRSSKLNETKEQKAERLKRNRQTNLSKENCPYNTNSYAKNTTLCTNVISDTTDVQQHKAAISTCSKSINNTKILPPKTHVFNKSQQPMCAQPEYLAQFDSENYGQLHQQLWAQQNIRKFHDEIALTIYKCIVCHEAWPINRNTGNTEQYTCTRCKRDKFIPKKFSLGNSMIPTNVPTELEDLTQVEEMLIAKALPVMSVYVKPGGQRAYSGHCINFPQDVKQLAKILPRYPKDVSVIILKMKGKDNTFKDVRVRRKKVLDALTWLVQNNPLYDDVLIDMQCINQLPEDGISNDLISFTTDEESSSHYELDPDVGPVGNDENDIAYTKDIDTSSFVPLSDNQVLEIQSMQQQLSDGPIDTGPLLQSKHLVNIQHHF